ncbi:hypothetical protein PsYK624_080680 [Phanerochaete sordida]|uniref:Uncharacterized protein n=1 Tax=Phanerochaete sordida TaxID=48140 RepID=A0A9P3LDW3_9APHY|nr:hypothetical protein PsYK624_080680 [Phanerochaete sordida]
MKTIHAIPEELVREILHLALLIPSEDGFYDDQLREAGRVERKYGAPLAAHIPLVCRKHALHHLARARGSDAGCRCGRACRGGSAVHSCVLSAACLTFGAARRGVFFTFLAAWHT